MRRNKPKTALVPRRQFLLGASYVVSSAIVGGGLSAWPSAGAAQDTRLRPLKFKSQASVNTSIKKAPESPQNLTIASLVDTIIPADESLGAIDLELHTKLRLAMLKQPATKAWVERMIQLVSQSSLAEYRKEFRDLDIDRREGLINRHLANTTKTIITEDLSKLRKLLLTWYYRSNEGAATIGFYLPANYPSYPGQR